MRLVRERPNAPEDAPLTSVCSCKWNSWQEFCSSFLHFAEAGYTWNMTDSASSKWIKIAAVAAITVAAFWAGGGWRFFSNEDMYATWHNTPSEFKKLGAYVITFQTFGIAQAESVLLMTGLLSWLWNRKQNYWWLWTFFLVSFVAGGYKLFLDPGVYFIGSLAGKDPSQYPFFIWWCLPFLVNGGLMGIAASAIVLIALKLKRNKRYSDPA
jgi:hypothetical protein